MSKMTTEEAKKIADQLREAGYQGPVKKTTVGNDDFVIRALTKPEFDMLRSTLPPTATRDDMSRIIVDQCVFPQLDWDQLGFAMITTLSNKVEWLSGRPFPDTIQAYLADVGVIADKGWAAPTKEDIEQIKSIYDDVPFTTVKLTVIGSYYFIYRSISKSEYDKCISLAGDNFQKMREEVLKTGVLWPQTIDWDSVPGWTDETLEEKIYLASGYNSEVSITEDEDL